MKNKLKKDLIITIRVSKIDKMKFESIAKKNNRNLSKQLLYWIEINYND